MTLRDSEYYYDDCSGLCFPCPEDFGEVLRNLARGGPSGDEGAGGYWGRFVGSRACAYKAFLQEDKNSQISPVTDSETLAARIFATGFRQLLLVVTEACNLRCRYCIFSENYPFPRPSIQGTMSRDTALAATRYYLKEVERIRRRNPVRPVVITFYGGEPLLNYPVIESVIEYIRSQGIRNVTFSVSTNGLLLDDVIGDYLVENDVSIAVSLDGPQPEHDRNRVNRDGEGSFGRVFANVERFWSRHPDYPYLIFLVTYDPGTDLEELRRFFCSDPRFRRTPMIFSEVSPNFTEYYSQFSHEQLQQFREVVRIIKRDLQVPGMKYGRGDPVLDFLFALPIYFCFKRRIFGPLGRDEIPATSTCLPGEKICVLPSGDIQVCERAPGLKIGTLAHGLDFRLIRNLIGEYNRLITSHCGGCPITRLCGSCFATFWSGDAFRYPYKGFCRTRAKVAKDTLEDAWSVLEVNPDFFSDSDHMDQQVFRRLKSLTM